MTLLLEHQANPNLRANDRSTPLMEAVTFAKMGAVKLLIDHGADVSLADANDTTPLMLAAEASPYIKDPAAFIQLLLEHGAKKTAVDSHGRTALQRATESKNAAAMEALK
jgi:ankyrin repeat protein